MNKKNLISIFIILICVLFISNDVFAENPGQKGEIPTEAKTLKGDRPDLKITDVIAVKYPSPKDITLKNITKEYCGEITVKTNIKSSNDAWAIGIVISAPLERKSYYPEYMDELYRSNSTVGKGVFSVKKNSYYYSPGSETNEFKSYIYSSSELCKYNSLDVYVFKPYLTALGNQDQVQVYYTQIINGNQITNLSKGKVRSYDLKDSAGYLYHKNEYLDGITREPVYFYNIDYAYDVPFVKEEVEKKEVKSKTSSTSKESTIPCDDSFISVPGYPYNYKCSDDHKKYQVCINGVIDSEHVFSKNSKLKAILCKGEPIVSAPVIPSLPSEQSSLTSEQSTVLTIENEGYVSDVKFLYNSDWKDVTLIDYPNAYVFENKLQDSKIKINLDSFKEDKVYAIISTSSQKEKIETALKEIYQTGTFSNYTEQTENNPFVIDNKFSGFSKLKYNSNNIILEIKKENTTEDIIFIFMQKTKEDKISLLYTNFYALDQKSQSLFYFCLINKNIVDFYCKGHSCNLDISCLGSKRWDFNPNIFENITFTKVKTSETVPTESTSTEPVTPSTTPTTPTPDTQQTTVSLEKGADGCYTTNPSTLAKIKQENGIGITKQIFSGKRNANSIVFPTNNTGTDDDPSLTIAQIRAVFNRSSLDIPQKVKDASPAFYNLGLLYNIDPVYSLAFFRIEKSLFNQNSGSITSSIISKNDISGVSVCRCGGTKSGVYCSYPTLEQGIEAFYLNLVSGTNSAPNFYKDEKFQSVAIKWNRGNITSQEGITYSNQIITFLSDIYNWAGK